MRQIARLSLRDLLFVLCRDRWKIAVAALAALFAAAFWLFFIADTTYVAESRVLVRMGREKLTGIETLNRDNGNFLFQERNQDINNTIELLRDPQFIYPVIDRLSAGLGADALPPEGWFRRAKYEIKRAVADLREWISAPLYWLGLRTRIPEKEALAQVFRNALHVEGMEDTDVIRVTFAWTDPEFAAQAANSVVDALLSRQVKVYGSGAPGKFYGEQLAEQDGRARSAEQELAHFRSRHDITNLPLQKEMLLREINEAETRRNEARLRLAEDRALEAWVRKETVRVAAPGGVTDDVSVWPTTPEVRGKAVLDVSALDRQFFDLVARRTQLGATQVVGSPELQQLTQRIAGLRREKLDVIAAHARTALEIDGREHTALSQQVEQKRKRLDMLNAASADHATLERSHQTAEQELLAFTRKSEELRVAELLNDRLISGLRVMSPARPPVEPAAPRKGLVLGLALVIGLLLGLAYSALLEYFDHSFRGAEDVHHMLGMRLLMTVPRVNYGRKA